jgi:hypothetical protein
MVAHTLARAAISWSRRCTFETLPICITPLLNNEMMSLCLSKKKSQWTLLTLALAISLFQTSKKN